MAEASGSDWSDRENAAAYRAFTRSFPMYSDTSRDLVARAGIGTASSVVDLCSGTGATTEMILADLPRTGRVLAVDGSAAMQAESQNAIRDPRVRYAVGRAEEFDQHLKEPVDAVICNSAIWQTDMPATFAAAKRALRPGGRLVFNLGGAFAGLPPTPAPGPPKPGLYDLMLAYAILDHDFVPTRRGQRSPEWTTATIQGWLRDSGFTPTATDTVDYPRNIDQTRAWLSIPVFSFPYSSLSYEQRMDILAKAYHRVDKQAPSGADPWLLVTATAP
jgi:SAM-dependent methyltransferase